MGESILVLTINDHAMRLHSKYLCLYQQVSVALNLGQKNFFVKLLVVNSENHNWSKD